jgi:putative ABC transport system permease protein
VRLELPPLALLWAALRAQPGRFALTIIAIGLGVALGVAVHTINASAIAEMNQAARVLSGAADLRVEAGRSGFDEKVFASIVMHPAVAAASPVVETDARVLDNGKTARGVRIAGIDPLRAGWIQPGLVPKPFDNTDTVAMLRPGKVFLNAPAMRMLSANQGSTLNVESPRGSVALQVAGNIEADNTNAPLAVMDIAAMQDAFALTGRLSRIDVRLVAGIEQTAARKELEAILPAGLLLTAPAQATARTESLSRAYRVNLTVLALVALFTGAFLVFSVSALSVVRRRSELALLRVVGVTRGGLAAGLTAEGAATGFIGGVLGVAGGLLLAHLALRLFAESLGGGFFAGIEPRLAYDWFALAAFCALGTAAGAAGALLPALEAAMRPPALALKAGDDTAVMQHRPPVRVGAVLLCIGAALLMVPPIHGLPLAGFAAIAFLLLGTLALLPAMLEAVTSRLPLPTNTTAQLAWQQLRGIPGYAVSGLATVIVSFSLVAAMAIMVQSFRSSLDQWLVGVLDAHLYLRSPGGITAKIPQALAEQIAALPGVTRAERLRYQSVLLDGNEGAVTLIARPLDETTIKSLTVVERYAGKAPQGVPSAWVSEAMVGIFGAKPGSTLQLPLGGKQVDTFVAGVWRDYARTWGAVVIDEADYVRLTQERDINDLALTLSDAQSVPAMRRAIRALPGGDRLEIAESAEIRKLSLTIFDRTFAVTYALEFAALLVGLAGISAHFSALAFARRREFGMLRHLGFTRRDVGRLLAMEGATVGVVGAAIGLVLGFAISLVLIYVVNRQSFHWGMELYPPWAALLVLSASLIALAAVAARVAGRLAMTRAAVLAVKEDA